MPKEQPVKSFQFDPKNLFDKPDSSKLKNEKNLDAAGQYLQSQKFGFAVITSSTGSTGDTDKQLALSDARGYLIRKYLVDKFPMDDTRLKTLGLARVPRRARTAASRSWSTPPRPRPQPLPRRRRSTNRHSRCRKEADRSPWILR